MSAQPAPELAQITPAPAVTRRASILAGLVGATAVTALASTASAAEGSPDLKDVRALLKAHDEAMKRQDLNGILALMAGKSVVIGTGPGEVWSGHDEIKTAYEHFFQTYDKGEQEFDYHFKIGGLGSDMGWLVASGDVSGKKGGKAFAFPLNLSLTVTKASGKWLIASLHFSTLTGPNSK